MPMALKPYTYVLKRSQVQTIFLKYKKKQKKHTFIFQVK